MSLRKQVFEPDSGGVKITEDVKGRVEERILRYAEANFTGRYTRLSIRFRSQFCYVDAYAEPELFGFNWPSPGAPKSREVHLERLRNTPIHLFRLRYFGDEERWGLAF